MESRSGRRERSQRGYTLIELLAVIGIIAMLTGVGVGLMSGARNDLERSTVALRQYARSAWLRSRQQQAPTILSLVEASDEEEPSKLVLHGLYLASEWNFDKSEQGSPMDVFGFGGNLEGALIEPDGRHGNCLVPDPEGGRNALTVRLESESAFDFRDGCLIQFDLYLEDYSDCKVLEMERMIEMGVDGGGLVESRVSLEGAGAQVGSRVTLKATKPLSLKEWHRIQLRAQPGDFALLVDGVEVAHRQKIGVAGETPASLYWNRQGLLKISDGGLPVPGRIDSIRMYGYEILNEETLPVDVDIQATAMDLHFTANGSLDRFYHPELPRFLLSGQEGQELVEFEQNGLVK